MVIDGQRVIVAYWGNSRDKSRCAIIATGNEQGERQAYLGSVKGPKPELPMCKAHYDELEADTREILRWGQKIPNWMFGNIVNRLRKEHKPCHN